MRGSTVRRALAFVVVIGLGLGTAACSWTDNDTRSATQGLPDVTQALRAESWILDVDASSLGPLPGTAVTLAFDEDALSGDGPCNTYRGAYSVDDHTLRIDPLATSLRACEGDVGAAEASYLAALEGSHTVDVTDRDRLVLTHDDVRLEYTAADRS